MHASYVLTLAFSLRIGYWLGRGPFIHRLRTITGWRYDCSLRREASGNTRLFDILAHNSDTQCECYVYCADSLESY